MSTKKIFSNIELSDVLGWLIGRWAGTPGATVRLFTNDIDPTPATVIGDLVEATFDTYNPHMLSGDLSGAVKVSDGHYESVSSVITYFPPASAPSETVHGAYVLFASALVAITKFDDSLLMQPGGPAFLMQLRVSTKSESLFSVTVS